MINDIEAARSRLDRLYQMMDVDEIAERMREFGSPTTPERNDQVNFLYTIRIVRAENLLALDNNGFSDPYVVLEINKEEIARTRTVYKSLTPRWDQTFDICLNERSADVLAIVYDEDVIGSNGECGSVWFKLSPKYYDDYQTHEFTLPLHPQGKLQLRVSMVGEKDDIQFWFVRAFRTLKRAENDAASLIVDQVCIGNSGLQSSIHLSSICRWVNLCAIVFRAGRLTNCYVVKRVSSHHSAARSISKWNQAYKIVRTPLHLCSTILKRISRRSMIIYPRPTCNWW